MKKILGIDLGTSSVKLLLTADPPVTASAPYRDKGAGDSSITGAGEGAGAGVRPNANAGMNFGVEKNTGGSAIADAVADALRRLNIIVSLRDVEAIGLSGQTGTYAVISPERPEKVRFWLPWHSPGREAYLDKLLRDVDQSEFLRLTGMRHPRLASYPLPSLMYMKDKRPYLLSGCLVLQPKDYLCGLLTGVYASDAGSWRGFVDPKTKRYPKRLLDYAGVAEGALPAIAEWSAVSRAGAALFGLREGVPVAVGHNDFYSALIGAGVDGPGACFDVTGTSEHFGAATADYIDTALISSPFRDHYVHYGVTASSGKSLMAAERCFGACEPAVPARAPVFLPYLSGERAPVFDPGARGVFAGLTENCGPEILKYSMMEGVVFSIYDIYGNLSSPAIRGAVSVTGGASSSALLNRLKASIFNAPFVSDAFDCGSAIGAVIAAGGEWARRETVFVPEPGLTEFLRRRFEAYRRLYPAWRDIARGLDTAALFG